MKAAILERQMAKQREREREMGGREGLSSFGCEIARENEISVSRRRVWTIAEA